LYEEVFEMPAKQCMAVIPFVFGHGDVAKDRTVNFEVMDAHTGKSVLNFGDYHDAKISKDEKFLVTLSEGNKVGIHDMDDLQKNSMWINNKATDGRVSFIFLPGDDEVLMTFGNRLIYWNLDL
jgi:hypothetical protein